MKRSLIIIIMCLVASVGMAETVKFIESNKSYNHPYLIIESSDAWNYEDGVMCDKCIMEITDPSGKKTSIPFEGGGEPINIKFIDRLKWH